MVEVERLEVEFMPQLLFSERNRTQAQRTAVPRSWRPRSMTSIERYECLRLVSRGCLITIHVTLPFIRLVLLGAHNISYLKDQTQH